MSLSTEELKTFHSIVTFVEDLHTVFGKKQKSLRLYKTLLDKTKLTNIVPIRRHIEAFLDFISKNESNIMEKNSSSLPSTTILYSKKVYIDMSEVFMTADTETTNVIWKHLLVIMNNVKPSIEAMNALKKIMSEKTNEGEFLTNIFQQIESKVDLTSGNPEVNMMNLFNSGVISEFVTGMSSGIQSGNLNIETLFGAVKGMIGNIIPQGGAEQLTLPTIAEEVSTD